MAPPQDPEDLLRAAADAQQIPHWWAAPIWKMEKGCQRGQMATLDSALLLYARRPTGWSHSAFLPCVIGLGILQLLFAIVVSNGGRLIGPS